MAGEHETEAEPSLVGDLAGFFFLLASFAVGALIVVMAVGWLAPHGDGPVLTILALGWFGPVPLWFWLGLGGRPRGWNLFVGVLVGGPTAIGYVVLLAIWMLLRLFGELLGALHF